MTTCPPLSGFSVGADYFFRSGPRRQYRCTLTGFRRVLTHGARVLPPGRVVRAEEFVTRAEVMVRSWCGAYYPSSRVGAALVALIDPSRLELPAGRRTVVIA